MEKEGADCEGVVMTEYPNELKLKVFDHHVDDKCTSATPCSEGEGECDSDSDCKEGLLCA